MYDLVCDWKNGFLPAPHKRTRVGYLVSLEGFGLTLERDIRVFVPEGAAEAAGAGENLRLDRGLVTVGGVLEQFAWGGLPGDGISIGAYVSEANAARIAKVVQTGSHVGVFGRLDWLVMSFDEHHKRWFAEARPAPGAAFRGKIARQGRSDVRLPIGEEGVAIAPHVPVRVKSLHLAVAPGGDAVYGLRLASSSEGSVCRKWGLKVGE